MSQTHEHIERIQQKLHLLLRQWTALRREFDKLQKENALLREQETAHRETITQLNRQVEVLQVTATTTLSETDKKAMEKKINSYIREIDRCIALLTE
jgi:predicted  nucleic acid-binding Zn-ribbon protein